MLVTRQAILVSRTKAINELKSLIVVAPNTSAPDCAGSAEQAAHRIAHLTSPAGATIEHRVTV